MVYFDEPSIYDQIEIEDMTFDPATQLYTYPCPCGDRFEIFIDDLRDGQDIAVCPSCSLMIQVIFEPVGRVAPSAKHALIVTGGSPRAYYYGAATADSGGGVIYTAGGLGQV
jgi:diphthamide biosynthesis protein 3